MGNDAVRLIRRAPSVNHTHTILLVALFLLPTLAPFAAVSAESRIESEDFDILDELSAVLSERQDVIDSQAIGQLANPMLEQLKLGIQETSVADPLHDIDEALDDVNLVETAAPHVVHPEPYQILTDEGSRPPGEVRNIWTTLFNLTDYVIWTRYVDKDGEVVEKYESITFISSLLSLLDSETDAFLHQMDIDDDGKSELCKITVAGDAKKLLDIEEVDSMPFISMTPVIMPHRFHGRSIAELVEDIQLIKSTVMRQMLDNMYLTNNNRVAIQDGQVAMDDLLTNRPGGIVRTKQPPQNVMMPIPAQPITEQASGMLAYLDAVKETRTGVSKTSQGLNPDSLNNNTATGMNQVLTQSQMRMELIARIFAETGVKDLALKIFELVCKYQQKEKIVRIRGKYIPMRPYEWKDRVNVTVQVGLGTGSKEQQLILLNAILERQMQAINLQQNAFGPMVNLRNIYNTLKKLVENAGLNGVEPFFMDPEVGQAQMPELPPKPPSEFEKVTLAQVQGENQRAQLKAETEVKRIEAQMRQNLLDFELKIKEIELKYNWDENF